MPDCLMTDKGVLYRPYKTESHEDALSMAQSCTQKESRLAVVTGEGPYQVEWRECRLGKEYADDEYRKADTCVQELNKVSGGDSFILYHDTEWFNRWVVVRR